MRQLWARLFPPYEVRLTTAEVKNFLKDTSLCRDIIESKVLLELNDVERVLYSIRIDHVKPDNLALMLITNVVGRELGSGTHHIYRGVLSMNGQCMKGIWNSAQKELLQRGYCDQAEVDKDNAWLQKQIEGAG